MDEAIRNLPIALLVFATYFVEGTTGFGGSVLALPFAAMMLGLHTAVPVLVIQSWCLTVIIILESRKRIVWREFGHIVVLASLGLPVGMWLSGALPENILKWILACFVFVVGAHGLARGSLNNSVKPMSRAGKLVTSALLPVGGAIHGAFGTGGPVIVIYAARALADKTVFRVTICMVWLVMNSIMIGRFAASSRLQAHELTIALICLPFTLLGTAIGNKAHYRIDEALFRKLVYGILVAAALAMAWSLLAGR